MILFANSHPSPDLLAIGFCFLESDIGLLNTLDLVALEDEAMALAPDSGAVLMLNSSAARIVGLVRDGFERHEIIQALVKHSGATEGQIQKDFSALESTVQRWLDQASASGRPTRVATPLDPPMLRATYMLFGNKVRIDYPDYKFSSFLHPYFAAFQVATEEPDLRLQFKIEASLCTVHCGMATFKAPNEGGAGALGAVCQALLFHDKTEQEQLNVYLHCGGVLGRNGAWLIGGASGRGKSTMVAALDAAGHVTLADDILPIDPGARLAFPMPSSMSVKAGSWGRIAKSHPDQVASPVWKTVAGKTVLKIAPHNPPRNGDRTGHPIAGFLFPDRTDDDALAIEPMGIKEAMVSLCDKYGRFPSNHSDLQALASCVAAVPRYKLRYRDADCMVSELANLL